MHDSKYRYFRFLLIATVISYFCFLSPLFSQSGGAPGWFSNIGPSTGFGTSFVSTANNAGALYLNPAGLKHVLRTEVALTYVPLWEGASYNFVGFVIPSLAKSFGIAYSQLNSGDLISRDNFGNRIGTFSDTYRILTLGFGFGISKVISFGFAFKGLNHEFMKEHTYGLGIDGGLILGPFHGFRSGIRFMNVYADGYQGENRESFKEISPSYRYGISYSAFQNKIILSLDLESSRYRDEHTYLGLQLRATKNIIFKLGRRPTGSSVGIGFRLKDLFIDFAIIEHPLGSVQHFSISHHFGKSVEVVRREIIARKKSAEELYSLGLQMYNNQEFEGALFQFKQAVESWPKIEKKVSNILQKTAKIVELYTEAEERYELRKYRIAIDYAERCLNVEPNHKKAKELLEKAKIEWERANEALKFYTQGLEHEKAGNISDAIDMWEKTLEIDLEHAGAIAKLDEYKKSEPLKIEIIGLNEVFAAVYKFYSENPIGKIKLINEDVQDLKDIKVSVMVRKYFDYPTEDTRMQIGTLEGKSELEVPLYAIFNNRVLDLTVDTPVQAEITVSYQFRNRPVRHEQTAQFVIHNKNAIRWEHARTAAAFITPNEPIVLTFVNQAKTSVGEISDSRIPQKILDAMILFDALIASQLKYIPDPNNPYSQMKSKKVIDHLKYPRETLLHGGGDCDDLSVLYCSLLEAVGIKTKLVDIPQHLFMIFDTEYLPEKGPSVNTDKDMYVVYDNSIWIPVEVTELEKGFMQAWKIAARKYNKWSRQ